MNKTIVKLCSIVAVTSALAVGIANAAVVQVDTSGLSTEQVNQLKQQAQSMKSDPANVSAKVRQEAEAWSELGANMGKAMVGAAREIGVAANEFATTPLGKVVVVMTAYKIAGKDLLGVVFGSIIMVFGYSLALWIFFTRRWSKVKYEYEPMFWGAFKRARIISTETDEDVATTKVVTGGIILALTTFISLIIIF